MKLQASAGRWAPYQVRDSIIISRRGATAASMGAFMNRLALRRERGAVLSKRDGIRHWQEGRQPGSYAAFTKLLCASLARGVLLQMRRAPTRREAPYKIEIACYRPERRCH